MEPPIAGAADAAVAGTGAVAIAFVGAVYKCVAWDSARRHRHSSAKGPAGWGGGECRCPIRRETVVVVTAAAVAVRQPAMVVAPPEHSLSRGRPSSEVEPATAN